MLHVIDQTEALRAWLPILVEVLENNAILIVLDNLESLLTEVGQWRDERWGLLVAALLTPGGLSRTVLTSRTRPAGLPASAEIIPVHALPRDEAVLLVRELPKLRGLLDGKAGVSQAEGRQLVRRVLRLVQGHPKLIELAEGLAADPAQLRARLDQADAAAAAGARSGDLDTFFAQGETRLDEAAFMASLRGWTNGVAGALPEASRLFFQFLCSLEEGDRLSSIIEMNWSDLWQRLDHPAPVPEIAAVLAPLLAVGLVEREVSGPEADDYALEIHAGVAEAGRAEAGPTLQEAVDRELAATWRTLWAHASEAHGRDPWAGPMLVRAGLAAVPYLARLGEWPAASVLLERVVHLDTSPGTTASVLPLVQRLVAATARTERELIDRAILAKLLRQANRRDEAEALTREVVAQAAERGEFGLASAVSGDLANLLQDAGQLKAALQAVKQKAEYTRLAGHGPWTQLADEGRQLQIRKQLGEWQDVLSRMTELLPEMERLPDPPDDNDRFINVWNVRETTLDVGRSAALKLREWQQALDLNAAQLKSKTERGAGAFDWACTLFNDYGPLLNLKSYDEADTLLHQCRTVFEQANAVAELGMVFSALADLESRRDRPEAARRFEETALRYKYADGTPDSATVSHYNLANKLTRLGDSWRDVLGHRLAAALITATTGSGELAGTISALAGDLTRAGEHAAAVMPTSFAVLCAVVQQVPGVRFQELMERLAPNEDLDAMLRAAIDAAEEINARDRDHPGGEQA